jgi:L-serine deaminase
MEVDYMNNRDKTISFRLNNKELDIFDNRVKESGLSKTEYIIKSCLSERPMTYSSVTASSCSIRREVDILEEKLIRTGELSVEDLLGIKKELERRWK